MRHNRSFVDYAMDLVIFLVMILIIMLTLYPFINSLAVSFNHADDTTKGGVSLWPRVFTTRNYELIFNNPKIYTAYGVTIARTVLGAVGALFVTGLLAFGLSHSNLVGHRFYTIFCLIPMYFGGGLIPSYFLIKTLGITNNFLVYVIPNLVGLWNMLLMRTYFRGIPIALEESARIDGASYFTVFFRIIFPISTPIVATILLYAGVWQWNAWFDAAIYITSDKLKPMQSVLLSIINEARYAEQLAAASSGAIDMGNIGIGKQVNVRSITMATMIVTIIPIIMTYPFLQRYFIKGIMIGSIKG